MNKLFIGLIYTLLATISCSHKDDPKPPAGSKGKYDFSSVDQFIVDNIAVYNNHVAVLVVQDGQLIYQQELGLRINRKLPIASASKWLSGAVIMSLVDEGKLSLDDTVGRFLPVFTQYHKGNISIRQLFSHTAGFESNMNAADLSAKYEYRKDLTLEQSVDSIAEHVSLINAPGTAFNYGETSMQIGGRIAEVLSGKPWQELFNEKIAIPCHMQAEYQRDASINTLIAGGASTSAQDYLHFLEMIVNKGIYNGTRVLSEEAIGLMEQDQTGGATVEASPYTANTFTSPAVSPVRYGIGNWLDVLDNTGNIMESSSPGLFGTHPWQDSKHHIAGIIVTFTTPKQSNTVSLKTRQLIRDIVDTY